MIIIVSRMPVLLTSIVLCTVTKNTYILGSKHQFIRQCTVCHLYPLRCFCAHISKSDYVGRRSGSKILAGVNMHCSPCHVPSTTIITSISFNRSSSSPGKSCCSNRTQAEGMESVQFRRLRELQGTCARHVSICSYRRDAHTKERLTSHRRAL